MLLALVGQRVREGGLARLLGSEFLLGPGTSATGFYRPVVLLSLFLDGRLGGGAAWAYHATNILLHALCSVLVLALARRLLTPAGALAAALLFALHPVHAEAVAFVSARTDLWAAAFVLASVLLWLRCRGRGEGAFGWTGGASALCLLLGALSKEISLVLPAVLLAWEALSSPAGAGARPKGTGSGGRDGARGSSCGPRREPWSSRSTAGWRGRHGARRRTPRPRRRALPFVPLLLSRAMGYLRLLFLPWPLSANYTAGDLAPDPGWILGAAAAAAVILAGCLLLPGRTGWKGALWTGLFLAPVMGFVPIASAVIAERFLYLPSVGFCLIVGGLYGRWRDARNRPVADLAMAVVLVCCAAGALAGQRPWRDEETLYTRMARTSPDCFVAHLNLGNTLARAGRIEEARAEFQRAVELAPSRADAWNNLGSARETPRGREPARPRRTGRPRACAPTTRSSP